MREASAWWWCTCRWVVGVMYERRGRRMGPGGRGTAQGHLSRLEDARVSCVLTMTRTAVNARAEVLYVVALFVKVMGLCVCV